MARGSSPVLLSLAALAIAAAVAVGCGEASPDGSASSAVRFDACRPLTLLVDEGVTPGHLAGVRAAVELWNGRASTRIDVAAQAAGAPVLPLHFQIAASPSHGLFDPRAGLVFVNDELTGHPLAVTVAHEIGHAFGLVHVTDRASVMTPGNLDVEPNADDVNALAALWGPCGATDEGGEAP